MTDTEMRFSAIGVGQSGKNRYSFNLRFLEPVEVEDMSFIYSDKEIQFKIPKKREEMWPRLQVQNQKPHWLRVDFDHFLEDEEEPDGDDVDENFENISPEEKRQRLDELKSLIEQTEKEREITKSRIEVAKRSYLLIFNSVQAIVYLVLLGQLTFLLLQRKYGMKIAYDRTEQWMKFGQLLSFFEIFHAVTGIVKSNVVSTVVQVLGRNILLFMIISPAEDMHHKLPVFTLFYAWACAESIRYPYYAICALNKEVKFLTWLRYTMWMVLYPLGGVSEVACTWLALPYILENKPFSYHLPNPLNFSFDFATYTRIHLILVPLGVSMNMLYLHKQRKKRLSKEKSD